jgi:hypothetical protein
MTTPIDVAVAWARDQLAIAQPGSDMTFDLPSAVVTVNDCRELQRRLRELPRVQDVSVLRSYVIVAVAV